jgi:tetratricopeptide (TPR) repeat protein
MVLNRRHLWHLCAIAALLVLAVWAYRPGLSGNFLFDDFGSLPALGANGPVDNSIALSRYLTSGGGDPTGRPLALASFLVDAHDWPADPYPFKRTNMLLHLLNGMLLVWLLLRLGRALRLPEPLACNAALLGAGIWLLHPLLVSTTLYVVQREAMLSAMFSLIGLIGWVVAREALVRGRLIGGLFGMTAAVVGCTFLGILCKANGALLPLLILLSEWLLLAPSQPMPSVSLGRWRRRAAWLLLVIPTLLLCLWLLWQIPAAIAGAKAIRDWTLWQRVLSEPRVLTDYLGLLFLPHADSRGLFNDGFAASTGLLHPWATLPCMVALVVLIAAGFSLRRRFPAVAFALLFFFAGHLLESTVIPLELYFEHRNYLPAMMLFWPLAIMLLQPGPRPLLRRAIALSLPLLVCVMTWSRASLWGNDYEQALVWARHNPDSPRAQTNAARFEITHGRAPFAVVRMWRMLPSHPQDVQMPLAMIDAECQVGAVHAESLAAANAALTRARVGEEVSFQWLSAAIDRARDGSCVGLDFTVLHSLLESTRGNRIWQSSPGRRQDLANLEGMLALAQQQPEQAFRAFNRALTDDPQPSVALNQAAALGSHGFPRLGLAHLDLYAHLPRPIESLSGMARVHAWLLHRQHYWEQEIAHLRAALEADANKQVVASPAGADKS